MGGIWAAPWGVARSRPYRAQIQTECVQTSSLSLASPLSKGTAASSSYDSTVTVCQKKHTKSRRASAGRDGDACTNRGLPPIYASEESSFGRRPTRGLVRRTAPRRAYWYRQDDDGSGGGVSRPSSLCPLRLPAAAASSSQHNASSPRAELLDTYAAAPALVPIETGIGRHRQAFQRRMVEKGNNVPRTRSSFDRPRGPSSFSVGDARGGRHLRRRCPSCRRLVVVLR